MVEGGIEFDIKFENIKEVQDLLRQFPIEMKEEVFRSFQRTAAKQEKELKATTGFRDVTGKLRRTLFVVATYNPLGIEMGSWSDYAKYVAEGHGTWLGNWWETFKRRSIPEISISIEKALTRIVEKYNRLVT